MTFDDYWQEKIHAHMTFIKCASGVPEEKALKVLRTMMENAYLTGKKEGMLVAKEIYSSP